MIQLLSAVLVTLLTVFLGPFLRGEVEGRVVRRARAVAELREKVSPGSAAQRHLDALLDAQAAVIRVKGHSRLHRKLNGGNVAALIFVGLLGGGLVYVLVSLALLLAGTPLLYWLVLAAAGLVGFMTVGLAAAGSRTIFDPKKK